MKTKSLLLTLFLTVFILSCSKNVDFTSEFMNQTTGRYLFTPDEVIEVYYVNKKLLLKWRGVEKIKPVILDQNTFFVPDMYQKLRFIQHPKTKKYYLSKVIPDNEDLITYDYLKLEDSLRIPSVYLRIGNYDKALAGYLQLKKQDSTSMLIDEGEFNRFGYDILREQKYQYAINIFKINVALYPESSNVYDSLADAYLRSGDSLQAYNNYKRALELNNENRRAKQYVDAYIKKTN